ncbi:hypothetical protein Clacol_000288 [Clathrus columnatus]|uniref:Peptidase C15, pyroglutamyl peptidase I-like protein n=1 Tax=Clathrus columnatus TaxID=1419009 RepID=A0AAV5A097_9AGAM|nr:hypothetical protein Clacol_000288 [Clathrus columnatus]
MIIRTPSGAKIHITSLGPIRVTYTAVLKLLPLLYDSPPRLPNSAEAEEIIDPSEPMPPQEEFATPPESGYDLIFHVGAGRNGAATLEQIGHKSGYKSPDVAGEYAPVIGSGSDAKGDTAISEAEKFERDRLGDTAKRTKDQIRGYGTGYEKFPEELKTEVDASFVVTQLKLWGEPRVKPSVDAGHYLCDFICYGSLAESQRPLFYDKKSDASEKRPKSLFMHVPYDEGQPFMMDELVELVKQVVALVCTGEKAL